MKKIISILVFVIFSFSLSSCKWARESLEFTKTTLESFLNYLEVEDYNSALDMVHNKSSLNSSLFENEINEIENKKGVDFSQGTELKSNKDFKITGYTSEYMGSTYEATYGAYIGDIDCEIYVFILDNNDDSGIYKFTVII